MVRTGPLQAEIESKENEVKKGNDSLALRDENVLPLWRESLSSSTRLSTD